VACACGKSHDVCLVALKVIRALAERGYLQASLMQLCHARCVESERERTSRGPTSPSAAVCAPQLRPPQPGVAANTADSLS
jgi:hypothetical protein